MKAALRSLVTYPSSLFLSVISVLVAGLLNALLALLDSRLLLPFFFDSVFTIMVGALFGWFPGVVAGLWTSLACQLLFGFPRTAFVFAICNMATGALVGIMARGGFFRSAANVLLVMIIVTIVNAFLADLLATLLFGGLTGNTAVDYVVVGLLASGNTPLVSGFLARVPENAVDKGIAILLSFYLVRFLTPSLRKSSRNMRFWR